MMTSCFFFAEGCSEWYLKEKPMDTVELAIKVEVVFFEQTSNQPIGWTSWAFNFSATQNFQFFPNTVDGSEIPNSHRLDVSNPVNRGDIYHINWCSPDFWAINWCTHPYKFEGLTSWAELYKQLTIPKECCSLLRLNLLWWLRRDKKHVPTM